MLKLFIFCIAIIAIEAERVNPRHKSISPSLHKMQKRYAQSYAGSSAGGYAGSSAGGYAGGGAGGFAGGYGGGGAGSFAGTGGPGGYIGSFAGDYPYDYAGTGFGYAPYFGPGFIDPYEFHQQLTQQILAQQAATQNRILAQQLYFDAVRRQSLYNRGGSTSSHRYAPNFSAAGASIGPGGYRQTAYISPENPAVPNIHNRFGDISSPGGYKGVSVSSFSSSADVDGKRTSQRVAQTSVNDNGKVSTYTVHS